MYVRLGFFLAGDEARLIDTSTAIFSSVLSSGIGAIIGACDGVVERLVLLGGWDFRFSTTFTEIGMGIFGMFVFMLISTCSGTTTSGFEIVGVGSTDMDSVVEVLGLSVLSDPERVVVLLFRLFCCSSSVTYSVHFLRVVGPKLNKRDLYFFMRLICIIVENTYQNSSVGAWLGLET
jgi:hypothetical protein